MRSLVPGRHSQVNIKIHLSGPLARRLTDRINQQGDIVGDIATGTGRIIPGPRIDFQTGMLRPIGPGAQRMPETIHRPLSHHAEQQGI